MSVSCLALLFFIYYLYFLKEFPSLPSFFKKFPSHGFVLCLESPPKDSPLDLLVVLVVYFSFPLSFRIKYSEYFCNHKKCFMKGSDTIMFDLTGNINAYSFEKQ